jgi:hypothetical protein
VIKVSSEEVGNKLKSKVKLLISYPSFSCCDCNHIVREDNNRGERN